MWASVITIKEIINTSFIRTWRWSFRFFNKNLPNTKLLNVRIYFITLDQLVWLWLWSLNFDTSVTCFQCWFYLNFCIMYLCLKISWPKLDWLVLKICPLLFEMVCKFCFYNLNIIMLLLFSDSLLDPYQIELY